MRSEINSVAIQNEPSHLILKPRRKIRPDHSVQKSCHKRDVIATIPELLSRAIECVAR